MRTAALFIAFISAIAAAQQSAPARLTLSLQHRLESPQHVAAVSIRLTDFVNFIATSYKIPMLVEMPVPVPTLTIPEGTYTARQLLDRAAKQLSGFQWKDDDGVVHFYNLRLMNSHGNLLNVRIHRFSFPQDVGEFFYLLPPCINSTVQGYSCLGGVFTGVQLPELKREPLPCTETFRDVKARQILLAALKANKRFYVFIAFESTNPKLTSQFPYLNWFSRSLVPNKPSPIWVQKVQRR